MCARSWIQCARIPSVPTLLPLLNGPMRWTLELVSSTVCSPGISSLLVLAKCIFRPMESQSSSSCNGQWLSVKMLTGCPICPYHKPPLRFRSPWTPKFCNNSVCLKWSPLYSHLCATTTSRNRRLSKTDPASVHVCSKRFILQEGTLSTRLPRNFMLLFSQALSMGTCPSPHVRKDLLGKSQRFFPHFL